MGVLVLATSIIAASNLLVSMIRSNSVNMNSLQAYYYTQEAMEAFRNMRDTHFMHNVNFRGKNQVNLFGNDGSFLNDGRYVVSVNPDPSSLETSTLNMLVASSPWTLSDSKVYFNKDKTEKIETEFYRYCELNSLEVEGSDDLSGVDSADAVEVVCTTEWEENSRSRSVSLSTVLTNWRSE